MCVQVLSITLYFHADHDADKTISAFSVITIIHSEVWCRYSMSQLWNVDVLQHLELHLQCEIHCLDFKWWIQENVYNLLSPPSLDFGEQRLFGMQEEFLFRVRQTGRSSGWGWGRMSNLIHHSGKVCIQKNVNADQQERIKTTEPGPEHTLSDTGNSGSWSLFWSPQCWDTQSCHMTTRHPPSWLRACNITHTRRTRQRKLLNYSSICVCRWSFITWWHWFYSKWCEYSHPGSYGGWQKTLSVEEFLFVAPRLLSTKSDYAPRTAEKVNT